MKYLLLVLILLIPVILLSACASDYPTYDNYERITISKVLKDAKGTYIIHASNGYDYCTPDSELAQQAIDLMAVRYTPCVGYAIPQVTAHYISHSTDCYALTELIDDQK